MENKEQFEKLVKLKAKLQIVKDQESGKKASVEKKNNSYIVKLTNGFPMFEFDNEKEAQDMCKQIDIAQEKAYLRIKEEVEREMLSK